MNEDLWRRVHTEVGAVIVEGGTLWLTFGLLDALLREKAHEVQSVWYLEVVGVGIFLITLGLLLKLYRGS